MSLHSLTPEITLPNLTDEQKSAAMYFVNTYGHTYVLKFDMKGNARYTRKENSHRNWKDWNFLDYAGNGIVGWAQAEGYTFTTRAPKPSTFSWDKVGVEYNA